MVSNAFAASASRRLLVGRIQTWDAATSVRNTRSRGRDFRPTGQHSSNRQDFIAALMVGTDHQHLRQLSFETNMQLNVAVEEFFYLRIEGKFCHSVP